MKRRATGPTSTDRQAGWWEQAACRNADPETFFPRSQSNEASREAKAVCCGCPVRRECLNDALASGRTDGVWGGLTERERRALARHIARRRLREAS